MADGREAESSAAQRAYAEITERMASGELRPGIWLREESLATSMGISRTPVREALRKLNSEGLVRIERYRGAQVVAWSREQVAEIYGLRAVIEGYVAAVAAQNVTESTLSRLEANLAEYERTLAEGGAAARQRAAGLNNDFHAMLLEATGNSALIHLLTGVLGLPLVRRTFLRYSPRDLARSAEHHRELIEALQRGDATSAEMIMKVHIRAAQQAALEQQERDAPADG
ncbi:MULTISPECIES: GntR family transcriptional regulator [Streptomyces]|uniref:GntR family transcriptional regulator n=1 Tax=Streptomyces cacaoi TaxID=1898 RepID=A0A4Y3QWS9_STRCI|nr:MULTISPECIES: GntR family transcriptional regulator [Streptomyces]NNG86106.1 GntR family transcriptional regulator [Streptomyces cacaoi]GEB49053.1 GntR family transcriptional regulator [Streptomyces cacaoi]